jgi:hypothetical protein
LPQKLANIEGLLYIESDASGKGYDKYEEKTNFKLLSSGKGSSPTKSTWEVSDIDYLQKNTLISGEISIFWNKLEIHNLPGL